MGGGGGGVFFLLQPSQYFVVRNDLFSKFTGRPDLIAV